MNKKGQKSVLGFALVVVLFVLILVSFSIIPMFKESLDDVRDTTSLNCPGTTNFNQTDYADDNQFERLTRRPTCFVTGISMVYFIVTFLTAAFVWVWRNWSKLS